MPDDGLTMKQRRFAAVFDGNATKAAIAAGYSENNAASLGCILLQNAKVAEAIRNREREKEVFRILIASREERQGFWTKVMLDGGEKTADRLKASELLARSEGDFLDKVEHSGSVSLSEIFAEAAERRKAFAFPPPQTSVTQGRRTHADSQ